MGSPRAPYSDHQITDFFALLPDGSNRISQTDET